jgi:hypothetical protein
MNAPIDVSFFARNAKPLTSYRPYWAKRFGVAPFLPMSRAPKWSSWAGIRATSSW